MLPTKIYSLTLGASQSHRLLVSGQYFKVLSATGTVTVKSDFGTLSDLITGQGLEKTPFDYLLLTDTSGASNTVKVLIGDENFIDGIQGSVSITSNVVVTAASSGQWSPNIGTVSTTLVNATPTRKYFFIQNKDPVGIIYLSFGSAASSNGIRLLPGESFEMRDVIYTGAIYAIGTIASNTLYGCEFI